MTRREWLAMMSTAPFARRVAADRAERVAQIVAAFERQGIHRTGTDVDRASDATACDVFLTVGTSAVVYPAAGFVRHAKLQGAFTAEINLEHTPATSLVELPILGAAEDVLPQLDQLL